MAANLVTVARVVGDGHGVPVAEVVGHEPVVRARHDQDDPKWIQDLCARMKATKLATHIDSQTYRDAKANVKSLRAMRQSAFSKHPALCKAKAAVQRAKEKYNRAGAQFLRCKKVYPFWNIVKYQRCMVQHFAAEKYKAYEELKAARAHVAALRKNLEDSVAKAEATVKEMFASHFKNLADRVQRFRDEVTTRAQEAMCCIQTEYTCLQQLEARKQAWIIDERCKQRLGEAINRDQLANIEEAPAKTQFALEAAQTTHSRCEQRVQRLDALWERLQARNLITF